MAKKQPTKMKGVSSVTRNGADYWYANIAGKKTYCGAGDKGRKLAEAARAKAVAKGYEYREVYAGLKVQRPDFRTVKEMLNWYMLEIPSVQAKPSYYRKTIAAGHLIRHIGDRAVEDMEEIAQDDYRAARRAEGAAENTVNAEIQTLRATYHAARRNKKIPSEFIPGRFVIVNDGNIRRLVTEGEFEKMLSHADPDFQDVLICGYESAMRSSEICNLTAGQVKLNVHHISGRKVDFIDLGIFDTKTGARRTVPVSAPLKEVLERRTKGLDPDERVFSINGKPIYNQVIVNNMITTCRRAGVPYGDKTLDKKGYKAGIVFHCFRHTRTSKWVEAGYSDEIVRRATGHKSLEAYQTYVKLDPAAVMRLVEPKTDNSGTKTLETLARR
jgi:integrase